MPHLDAADRADTFVPHDFDEHLVDPGEIRMNYATAGDPSLLLIPSQSESWWGYERAMPLLAPARPGLCHRPARPGPLHLDTGPLHTTASEQRSPASKPP